MKNIINKLKVRTLAIGFVSVAGIFYLGKKAIDYMNCIGDEPEPLTDAEIKETLGIGGCCGFEDK